MAETADYVVVGGGSAGAALAARLSENQRVRVLLIEAGRERDDLMVRLPAGLFNLIGNPAADWCRMAEPDPTIGGRAIPLPAGKMLGGSSSINGLVYARGSRRDYARWVEAGATGWSYDDLLPYFKRLESFQGPPSQDHGGRGPIQVTPADLHPTTRRFMGGAAAVGLAYRDDYCNGDVEGSYAVHGTIGHGRRSSSYHAYLKPIRDRTNLRVITDATVGNVLFDGRTAIGVRYWRCGQIFEAYAASEVVLCAGAFGSPIILQRSGIGPAATIRAAGIDPLIDLPAIGANLQDHLSNGITRFVDTPTFNILAKPWNAAAAATRWWLTGTGLLASASVQAMAYGRSPHVGDEPDYMLSFLPVCVDFSTGKPRLHRLQGVFIAANICRPRMRGRIEIVSPNVADAPRIHLPLLAEPEDARVLRHALGVIDNIYANGFADVLSDRQTDMLPTDEPGWTAWLRDRTALGYHSVGTCRMGGEDAALDPLLRVRGVDRLRVADASIMPSIISANTNAAAIAIGERAAEIILKERGR